MLFNEEGLVHTLTVGYCMDKRIGNRGTWRRVWTSGIGNRSIRRGAATLQPFMRIEAFERIARLEALALALLVTAQEEEEVLKEESSSV